MAKEKYVSAQKVAISRKKIGGEAPMVVAEVTEKCLYSGFFGTLDSARIQYVTEKMLDLLKSTGIEIVIIDLSNVDIIDSSGGVHLVKVAETMKLTGVETIFCGISTIIAQTMVGSGANLGKFKISRDFKSALKTVFLRQGLALIEFSKLPIAELAQQQQQQQQ